MSMSVSKTQRKGVSPEINVTPLVDVVLVLLIIFMVIMPQMDQNIPVELPGIFHVDPESKASMSPVEISIRKDGQVFIDKEAIPEMQVQPRLQAIHAKDALRRVVLRGDQGLDFTTVRGVFATVRQVGFPGVSLQVSALGDATTKEEH